MRWIVLSDGARNGPPHAAAAGVEGRIKRWLVDTGVGAHFVGRKYSTKNHVEAAVAMDPIIMATANGVHFGRPRRLALCR